MAALARHRAMSGGRNRLLPPGQSALLIPKHPEVKALGLQIQKGNLQVIVAVEEIMYTDDLVFLY